MFRRAILIALLLAGCQQLPLTPQDLQDRKFEPVPGKGVIYILRDAVDFSDQSATISLGKESSVTMYPGTYYRWVVAPGEYRVTGFGTDAGTISIKAEPGALVFVQQRVAPGRFSGSSSYEMIDESKAREIVSRSVLAGTQ